ncbi:MAG: tetratricopeptide repeat protein [Nostoc sp. GBBB01]|nr:tetratricopeptide repeat protein [Nostoc sp. GBBB01]
MLQRLWRWLERYFQRLFSDRQTLPLREQRQVQPSQRLTDAEYESLFFELLAEVERGSTKGEVKAFLDGKRINKAHLVEWLRGFGEGLVGLPNDELARRIVQLGELGIGEVSDVAYDIGRRLGRGKTNRRGAEDAEGEVEVKEITLDELLIRLQQDANLVQQVAQQLGIETSDPQIIIEALINQFNAANDSTTSEAKFWFNQGVDQYESGNFVSAIASYDKAIEFKANYHEAWNNRGNVLVNLEQFEEAIASYDKAIEFKGDDDSACYNRGVALFNLGRFEDAITSFDKAIEFKGDNDSAWYNRGVALDKLGRFEDAITSFDKAIEFKGDNDSAWYNRGVALVKFGRDEEAIESYDKAIEFKPDDPEAHYGRGGALYKLGRFEKAIASYDNALKIKPDFPEAWTNRGIQLENLNLYKKAIDCFNHALAINPNFPEVYNAWCGLGRTLRNLGEFEEAIASFDKAIEFKPDEDLAWIGRGITAGKVTGERIDFFFKFTLPDPPAPNLAFTFNNPDLNNRNYDGELASYEEGLKHCLNPEGSGKLHQAIGNAHYFRGRGNSNARYFWYKAVKSYKAALQTLTATDFPELHLEVLQNLIRVQLDLGETAEATELQRQGTDLLRRLLDEPNRSDRSRKQLALKFVWLQQLTVDLAVQSGDLLQAIELAEQGKNTCLRWILDKWNDENSSVSYSEIQQLLNPSTAIIYWHLSSYALHTFILKHNAPSPIVLGETEFVTHAQRLQDFEAWVKNWNQQYADYRDKAKDEQSRKIYPWRLMMPEKLEELKNILNISAIEQELNNVTNLILIPHRDLHRLPLHAIFTDNFTITYLPSAQIGINLKNLRETNVTAIHQLPLLSVEHPKREDFPMLPHAEIESAAITQLFQNPTPKRIAEEVATNTTVKAALQESYSIFHFTGHSTYNFHNPQESALALSGKEFLTLGEICNIENMRIYQLVSLSSCETAITSNRTITAEYVGLVSAFLYQGVTNVVSTLWTVTDDGSSFLMIYFYWQIKKGKSPAVALHKARKWLRNLTFSKLERIYRLIFVKLPSDEKPLRPFIRRKLNQISQMELLEKKEQRFQHPYYWAGFIITGGYRL